MLSIARRELLLMELHSFGYQKDPKGTGFYYGGNWLRDYVALLKQFVSEKQIQITKIPEEARPTKPWIQFGAIIEVVI